MIVLDTHVLVWWASGGAELSSAAAQAIDETLANSEDVIVSCISAWEIAMLIQKGRLVFSMDVETWLEQVAQIDGIRFVPVDNETGCKSTMLPGNFHKDPADRMIVATARKLAAPLVTADEKIINYEYIKTIW